MFTKGTVVLGRYEVDTLLGEGGMGAVYRGRHLHLDIDVALKVVHPNTNQEARHRFEREARMLARVRHPGVVGVMDFGFEGPTALLVMELLQGEDLDELLGRGGAFGAMAALPWLRDIAGGLAAIHEQGILHRDLKPSNVMVDQNRRARIVDFGLAREVNGSKLTRTGLVIGTPDYMSPEQLVSLELTEKTDIFSLGVIAFELLSGTRPYQCDNVMSVFQRANQRAPRVSAPPPLPSLHPALVGLVERMLEIDATARPSARQLVRDFEALSSQLPPLQTQPTVQVDPGATMQEAPATGGVPALLRGVLAARLPPSRLADAQERRLIAQACQPLGRAYILGAGLLLVVGEPASLRATTQAVGECGRALTARYGSTLRVLTAEAPASVAITPSMVTGARPFPTEISELLRQLMG